MGDWIAVITKPNQEVWAVENISRQGFEHYMPLIGQRTPRGELKRVPLFPRYVFVLTLGTWRSLLSTFGVSGVVLEGQRPAFMPARAIESLRAREDAQGLIHLPERPELTRFQHGDAVSIDKGAFEGKEGIYEGDAPHDRVRVLLDLLGRKIPVLIDEASLSPRTK